MKTIAEIWRELRPGHNSEAAADLTQDTFARVLTATSSGEADNPKAYLHRGRLIFPSILSVANAFFNGLILQTTNSRGSRTARHPQRLLSMIANGWRSSKKRCWSCLSGVSTDGTKAA
jgi:hypothetical protein